MTKENIRTISLISVIALIAMIMGFLNHSYVVSGMFIAVIAILGFIMKDRDLYDVMYGVLMFSLCFDYVLHVPGIENVYMFHIILFVFTLMSMYKFFTDSNVRKRIDKFVLVIFVVWFVYMCITVVWALNRTMSIKYIAIYLMMFAFIVDIMIYNINKERFALTVRLILGVIGFTIFVGFIELVTGHQLPVKHYADNFHNLSELHRHMINARPIAFSFNTNNLAATLAIITPICFFAIYKFENIILRIVLAILSITSFGLIVVTTSRTGTVAYLFGFIVFVAYSIFSIRNLGIKSIIVPVILTGGLFLAYNYSGLLVKMEPVNGEKNNITLSDKLHALEEMDFEEGGEGSINVRGTIIKDVLVTGLIENKQILGYGVGNVEQYVRNMGNTGTVFSPHCYPIEILGDFGVPGVALYGIYYLYVLLSNIVLGIKKKNTLCFAAVSGLIAFAPACFGPSSITYVFSYWLLMSFSIACIQAAKINEDSSYKRTKFKEYTFLR